MRRWTTYLWKALTALGETGYPWDLGPMDPRHTRQPGVDLRDDASVRAAFRSITEREWGAAAFDPRPPRRRPGSAGNPW